MRKVLVTGGAGFIGSHFVRALLAEGDTQVVNLDALTYAGNLANLADVADSVRYNFVRGDIRDMEVALELVKGVDCIVNFAAESHVDRSTKPGAGEFVDTNVYGTYVMLEAMRHVNRSACFLQVGTDEVYGSVAWPAFPTEQTCLQPSSPYSAAKAGADHIALAFHRTHDMDVLVSRCTNNYGPYQHPEKLVPLFITNALDNKELPLYDGGTQIRDWLHVEDHCKALLLLLDKGKSGEIYNIGANQTPEVTNNELTKMILDCVARPETLIRPVQGLRPGHDHRYAVDTSKIRALGWRPKADLGAGLAQTVAWYAARRDWWELKTRNDY
jgi:dTDP-glucose 4,6-dehydratase